MATTAIRSGDAEINDISLRFRAAGRLVRSDPQLLERIVSPESRQLLEALANGAPEAFTTRQARMALANLK